MDTNNEILDAIEILADKKIGDNITKVLTGICTSVNINKNTCVMDSNGVSGTVYFYGSPPEVNGLYRIFVPSNDMSRSFIIVPPKFTVNPNLLDNWHFQIWQRYQDGNYTGVPNGSYISDRWIITSSNGAITSNLTKATPYGGLKNASGPNCRITQRLENAEQYNGRTLTLSVLKNNGLHTTTKVPNGWTDATDVFAAFSAAVAWLNSGESILAAKLELSSQQTLAHLENGKWVLNEIPKYEDMLSNCQRYTFNVVNSDDNYEILGGGFAMNTSQFFCFIPTPVTLRGKPTVKYSGLFRAVRNISAADGIVINSISVDHASNNGVSIICSGTTSFEVGEFYTLWCVPGGGTNSLIFSADL